MIGYITCTRPDGSEFFVLNVAYALRADDSAKVRVDACANRGAREYARSGALTFHGMDGAQPVELY